ncbi:MAG: WD40 repeat domain-containing protein [Planctomycetota bacterium]|nr:WD40 repeat domain-containing protein [Planctomycetota bacterium]
MLSRTVLLLGALLTPVPAVSQIAADDIYVDPKPFGPRDASLPWHVVFSPDGKWAGIVDGHGRLSVDIFDVSTQRAVWSSSRENKKFAHRGVFAANSRRFVTVAGDDLLLLALSEDGWKTEKKIPLGFETVWPTYPAPVSLSADGEKAVFVDRGHVWRVSLINGKVERVASTANDVFHAYILPDDILAVVSAQKFQTRLIPEQGPAEELPGVLLNPSPDGSLWLVATDLHKFDMGSRHEKREYRLALAILEAKSMKEISSFELRSSGQKEKGKYRRRLLIAAEFSTDNKYLVTALGTGFIEIRETQTGEVIQRIDTYRDLNYAIGAAFSPDGSLLLTGGRNAGVLRWSRAKQAGEGK